MSRPAWTEGLSPDWVEALAPASARAGPGRGVLRRGGGRRARTYLPDRSRVLRAFSRPLADVRVLVVGPGPLPHRRPPGRARLLGRARRTTGPPLAAQRLRRARGRPRRAGRASTATSRRGSSRACCCSTGSSPSSPGGPGSHRRQGWEQVTQRAIEALVERGGPLVAVLWGGDARKLAPLLGDVPVVESAHPSPLSARYGFFGSRPFSRVNDLLVAQGAAPIDWQLPLPTL